ncbi:MAG: hypothetical protein Q4B03_04755 [Lachnospiraceae bacterium]|nr:hypothetical protein [Lachnospiraceae bacterium]
MSETYTFGQHLREHTPDLELPSDLARSLTETMIKHSNLHAAFVNKAKENPFAPFLQPALYKDRSGRAAELAAEAAEYLGNHGKTLIHDGMTSDRLIEKKGRLEVSYPTELYRGPFGYDAASLLVSFLLGWCHGNALIEDAFGRDDFCDSCLDLVSDLANGLIGSYDELFDILADAPETEAADFKRLYFEEMMPDLAAAAGLETLRVLMGDRPSPELQDIQDLEKRAEAEHILMYFAETCIKEKETFYFGADFAAVIERAAREAEL